MKLYQYAVIYNPLQTKEQQERGEVAKSLLIVNIKQVIASSEKEVMALAARDIPAEYADKLDCTEIMLRPFLNPTSATKAAGAVKVSPIQEIRYDYLDALRHAMVKKPMWQNRV